MIHKVDFDQIKDARVGVGLRTAFGGESGGTSAGMRAARRAQGAGLTRQDAPMTAA